MAQTLKYTVKNQFSVSNTGKLGGSTNLYIKDWKTLITIKILNHQCGLKKKSLEPLGSFLPRGTLPEMLRGKTVNEIENSYTADSVHSATA